MALEPGEKAPGGVGESGGWGSRNWVGLGEGRGRESGGPRAAQESRRTRGGEDLRRRNGRIHLSLGPRLAGLALLAFLSRKAGHPRVTLQREPRVGRAVAVAGTRSRVGSGWE